MYNQVVFSGFDTIIPGDTIESQISPYKLVGSAIVAPGRGDGQALQLSTQSALAMEYLAQPDVNIGVAAGQAIKHAGMQADDIAIVCAAAYGIATSVDDVLALPEYTAIVIKNNMLWLYEQHDGRLETIQLTALPEGMWMYIEFRTTKDDSSNLAFSTQAWCHGLKLFQRPSYSRSAELVPTVILASTQSGTLCIDDVYTRIGVGHWEHNDHPPILASGKVRPMTLERTVDSTWTVEGAANDIEALTDLSDTTVIKSETAAVGEYELTSNLSTLYGMNLILRARSDDGIGVVRMSLRNTDSGQEVTPINTAAPDTMTRIVHYPADLSSHWITALRAGAHLILRT